MREVGGTKDSVVLHMCLGFGFNFWTDIQM